MKRALALIRWLPIIFAFGLVLASTTCPEDDIVCVFRGQP